MLDMITGQAHLSLVAIICDSGLHMPLLGLADPHIYPCVFADVSHRVKTADNVQFGEHSWSFNHPDFH